MLTISHFFSHYKHALLAFSILLSAGGSSNAGPKDNVDDAAAKPESRAESKTESRQNDDSDDATIPKLLRGPISIEDNMRLRRDLDEYSRTVDPAHVQIEERRRMMHQRIQTRFVETDRDNDNKISRVEATESLPQVARHFNAVDINNDGYLTLDELEGLQARIIERQRIETIKIQDPPEADSQTKRKTKNAMLANRKRTL